MKKWTPQAEQRLNEYLVDRAKREHLEGEDAVELKDDLRRHVFEEAEKQPAEMIGLMNVETILGSMDAGYRPAPPVEIQPFRSRKFVWAFGVIFPLLVILVEIITGMCGSMFFDPVPTPWHLLLVASVPAINAWLLKGAPRAKDERWKGVAAGVAMAASFFYGLMFLPIIHWSVLAILFIGMGFLSLTPVLSALASWRISKRDHLTSPDTLRYRTGRRIGIACVAIIILLLEAPAVWTRVNMDSAASEAGNEAAIARLRSFHLERTLLRSCYQTRRGNGVAPDMWAWFTDSVSSGGFLFQGNLETRNPQRHRDVYFRVTGRPFNSVKPPVRRSGGMLGGGGTLDEFEFDDNLGGDSVVMRLKHLDLKESRFDGHLDSASEIGYGEWTMIFRNNARNAQEARCQVRLPEGGRVSRLTLWVNGEPREAAFSTVSKVKAAYKAIAVVQRRDPVLVTMVGPDTVLVQCFPVPAHGEMKIRFGITAPVKNATWELPRIVERNFGTVQKLEHAVWLQGDRDFHLTGSKPVASARDGDGRSLSVSLSASAIMDRGFGIVMDSENANAPLVWCEDRFAPAHERYLIREPRTLKTDAAGKVVMVIDGSKPLAPFKEMLVKSIDGNTITILADDSAKRVDAAGLAGYTFSGGRDNEAALLEGIRVSREQGGIPIVWVHGPQAVSVAKSERLSQLLERGSVKPVIHTIEAVPGPNRLAEVMYRSAPQVRGPALKDAASFKSYLAGLMEGKESTGWTWRRAASSTGLETQPVWDQLARLWAIGAAEGAPGMIVPEGERSALASRYQLVTPVSGAVVLETDEQYKSHGLTPTGTDAAPHMPAVPEPSSILLFVLTTGAALFRRKR